MGLEVQKANIWKRISAALFDGMLQCVLALGLLIVLTSVFGYSDRAAELSNIYKEYEISYGVDFDVSSAEYDEMTEAERDNFNAAVNALEEDGRTVRAYEMLLSLTLLIITFSILFAVFIWEFLIPLMLGNGQTLGKKIFGLGVMRAEGTKISAVAVFVRAILGKFTIEWMIPIYVITLIFINAIGFVGLLILFMLLVVQIICLAVTHVGALLHDVLARTVVIDLASQKIFNSKEEQLEYIKKLHAEKAASADY